MAAKISYVLSPTEYYVSGVRSIYWVSVAIYSDTGEG